MMLGTKVKAVLERPSRIWQDIRRDRVFNNLKLEYCCTELRKVH